MRLATKGRYAVIAMLDIAMHRQSGLASVAGIAQRQDRRAEEVILSQLA